LQLKISILSILSQTYFGKLFRLNKTLFVWVTAFFTFSVFANLIRLEISPFFVWNLYAEDYLPRKEYIVNEVRYDGKLLNFRHTWLEARQIVLSEPLANYLSVSVDQHPDFWSDYLEHHWSMMHPGFRSAISSLLNTPSQYDAFPAWYKKYLSHIKNEEITNISVTRKVLVFEKNGSLREIDSAKILVIR
jgi:hypothetical protein